MFDEYILVLKDSLFWANCYRYNTINKKIDVKHNFSDFFKARNTFEILKSIHHSSNSKKINLK